MKIYIPIATGQLVPSEVLNSITSQTVSCDVVVCDTPGLVNSQKTGGPGKVRGEAASRNLCQQKARECGDKFYIIQDSDMVHLQKTNIEEMLDFMQSNLMFSAIALNKLSATRSVYESHIQLSCILFRHWVSRLFYSYDPALHCVCGEFKTAMDLLGAKYRYLDIDVRLKEIDREVITKKEEPL